MIQNTQALVLRTIKYGETSIISTLYTKAFGMQAYLIQGARSNRKSGTKANLFQVGQFLEITAYHTPSKNLQRLKEVSLLEARTIQSDQIITQSVSQYCTELVLRCIKEEEKNEELFLFLKDAFSKMSSSSDLQLANFPIRFTLSFAKKIGFEINNNHSSERPIFNALEGSFVSQLEENIYAAPLDISSFIADFLSESKEIESNSATRKKILETLLWFLRIQLPQMQEIKCLDILHEILSD